MTLVQADRLPLKKTNVSRSNEPPSPVGASKRGAPAGLGGSVPIGVSTGVKDNFHLFTDDARNRIGLLTT